MNKKLIKIFSDVLLRHLKGNKSKFAKTSVKLIELTVSVLEDGKVDSKDFLQLAYESSTSKEEKAKIKELLDNK